MLNGSLKFMFPGFTYAVAIFSTYCVVEFTYLKLFPPKHGHGHGHDDHGHGHEKPEFDGAMYEGALEPKQPAH